MKVDSSSIKEVFYNKCGDLRVEFWSGAKYVYYDVPLEDYNNLIEAESVGRFFNKQIKKNYGCQRITELGPSAF